MNEDWSHRDFVTIARLFSASTGLAFTANRGGDTVAGIQRAMARSGVREPDRYLALIEHGIISWDDIISEVTIGETYFFRDPAHFDLILNTVLPDCQRRLGCLHEFRVWSAGCASGEEAYSLAILLREAGHANQARILATDISKTALAKARAGAYGKWSMRGVDDAFVQRNFQRSGEGWLLDEHHRKSVTIEYLNLAADAYPSKIKGIGGMDLIFCRNVLIYFDSETIARVARAFYDSLAIGGWLVTGPSDPPLNALAPFETVVTPTGVYYRRPEMQGRHIIPPFLLVTPPSLPAPAPEPAPELPVAAPQFHVPLPQPAAPAPRAREAAKAAFDAGDYDRLLDLTREQRDDHALSALRLRAIANRDGGRAAALAAGNAVRNHPQSAELHFLQAIFFVGLMQDHDAEMAIRKTLYLDRSLAVAHFVHGSIRRRLQDLPGAKRAYGIARDLALALPGDALLALGEGERANQLARAATAELALLDGWMEEAS